MGTILKPTPTEQLDETYDKFIGRILKETVENSSEKETSVLAEGQNKETQPKIELKESEVVIKTGNITEDKSSENDNVLSESDVASLRKMSGISRL
jgi:YesN/AraC family two-component response regulator